MKASSQLILIGTLTATLLAPAQTVQQEPDTDAVLEAIREFNRRDKSQANEVTVVLDPPAAAEPAALENAENPAPVLVTGKPPEDVVVIPDEATAQDEPAEDDLEAPVPDQATAGLAVRVEKLRTGKGEIDASTVKLQAPFPAKPLATPPAGWRLDSPADAPPITREVELSPGATITLTIRPHLLSPEADGAAVFEVPEPGFDAALGYHQTATVGAILANSIQKHEDDARDLGQAIERLQQLLVSLPTPEPEPSKP